MAYDNNVTIVRCQGKVKWFDTTKGFGFIRLEEENSKDIFVHQSTIHSDGFRSLAEGEIVEFDLVTDPKGQHAENVTGPGGSFVQGAPRPMKKQFGYPQQGYYDQQQQFGAGGQFQNEPYRFNQHPGNFAPQFHPAFYQQPLYAVPPQFAPMQPMMQVMPNQMMGGQQQQQGQYQQQVGQFQQQQDPNLNNQNLPQN